MKKIRPAQLRCYLCQSNEKITRDHVPPRNLFPPPKPTNLITVPCCSTCNHRCSLDDEAFRAFACSLLGGSPSAMWIWTNKVMASTFKRSPKLKESIRKGLQKVKVNLGGEIHELDAAIFSKERADRYLIRLTKGLITHFYPEVDYADEKFEVAQQMPTKEGIQTLMDNFLFDQRGGDVFRFWRKMMPTGKAYGVWIYLFYNSAQFMVSVGKFTDEI